MPSQSTQLGATARRLHWIPAVGAPGVDVAVLDSGYIRIKPADPSHATLDDRVTDADGYWLNSGTDPASWEPDPPDALTTDAQGALDGIVGHGTFIAGLIAHLCREAVLTVVGQRDQEFDIDPTVNRAASSPPSFDRTLDAALRRHRRDPVRFLVPDAGRPPVDPARGRDAGSRGPRRRVPGLWSLPRPATKSLPVATGLPRCRT